MPEPLNLPGLEVGTRIQDAFLVMDVSARTSNDGKPFTVLSLGNSSGQIATEPFWEERLGEVEGISTGSVVQVIGEVTTYRERRQVRVTSIRALPRESVDPKALLPSVGSIERYWERLDGWRSEIAKPRLRKVVDLFYRDDAFRVRYQECPAAVKGHHSAIGGLLKHTVEVAAIARAIARTCNADQELVLAGVLLHDVGKLDSYRWDTAFEFTEPGRLIGHVVLGAMELMRRIEAEPEPPCTAQERNILLHIILSHHGKLEFGSPVTPMLLEAEILHWADNASAKTASFADAGATAEAEGLFTAPRWELDRRRVYLGQTDWGAADG